MEYDAGLKSDATGNEVFTDKTGGEATTQLTGTYAHYAPFLKKTNVQRPKKTCLC